MKHTVAQTTVAGMYSVYLIRAVEVDNPLTSCCYFCKQDNCGLKAVMEVIQGYSYIYDVRLPI